MLRSPYIKFILLITLVTVIINNAVAQHKDEKEIGIISGRVIDSLNNIPVEYATISLIEASSGKVVNGTTTDINGSFEIEDVPEGNYDLLFYFIGYTKKEKKGVLVSKSAANVSIGDILLVNNQKQLKEVTVSADKNLIENKIDKMVYNAEKDATSQTGVASDMLKKVPQVSVDVNGNVELQGSANVRFLINGKPSIIFGNNIPDVLQSIPASQIQSIEVITSPGAKYDAEGTGGIINIILKKNNAQGINGNISISAGTRLENGAVNLNAHKGNFGANIFFSGNAQLPSTTLNKMDRLTQDSVSTTRLIQDGQSIFSRNGFESGAGFDWDITDHDNINGSFGFDYFSNNNSGFNARQNIVQDASSNPMSSYNDNATTKSNGTTRSLDYGLNYKHSFKNEDQELELSWESSNGNNYAYYKQTQEYLSNNFIYSGSYGKNPGVENENVFSIDYAQPLGEDAALEIGGRATINKVGSTSNVFVLDNSSGNYNYDPAQSMVLDYKSYVYAGYASLTFKLFDWLDLKPGARYEYTEPHAFFSNSGYVNIASYNTLVPSAVISHTFNKFQTVKLSYTRRIERPEYRDLNPFINAADPRNLTTGNTGLRPEIGDKVELGYSKILDKGASINATLFYRGNKDDIQGYTRYYSSFKVGDSIYNNVAVSTRENIGRENNFGLNLYASIPFTSKLNLRTNISCFQRYIINGTLAGKNVQGFNYRINMNASYEITKTFLVELFGNFNSPRINAQGTMPSFTTYNIALRKQFLHKKASLAITATNAFNKYVEQKTRLHGENFDLTNIRELPYRSFGINFTYKFGKLEFKKEKESEDPNLTNPPSGN